MARLDQAELARRCGLSLETIKRLERIRGPVDATVRTLNAIEEAFRLAAVVFEADESGRLGVYCLPRGGLGAESRRDGLKEPASAIPLQRLIYYSTAEPQIAATMQDFLSEVLATASKRNAAMGVTGALLTCNGRFLQALEGPKEAVLQIFGAISVDPRHHSLRILQCRPVVSRLFADWGLYCGMFASDAEVFALEPGMADGFRPELLSPAAALGLLSVVRDLQRQTPRSLCADPGRCSLTTECMDEICVASAGKRMNLSPQEMAAQ